MVERHLAKVNVASSNLVFRSIKNAAKCSVFLYIIFLSSSYIICFVDVYAILLIFYKVNLNPLQKLLIFDKIYVIMMKNM